MPDARPTETTGGRLRKFMFVTDAAEVFAALGVLVWRHAPGSSLTHYKPGPAMLEAVRDGCPDAVIIDLDARGDDMHALLARIAEQCPGAKLLALTADATPTGLQRARGAGALGYFGKSDRPAELFSGLLAVSRGESSASARFAPAS